MGLGFGFYGFESRVWGLGVSDVGFRVPGFCSRVLGGSGVGLDLSSFFSSFIPVIPIEPDIEI